jgi:YcxB-like protein
MTIAYRNKFGDRLAFAAYHLPRNPFFLFISIGFFLLITFQSLVPAFRAAPAGLPLVVRVLMFILFELFLAGLIVAMWTVITVLTMISRKNKPLTCQRTLTLNDENFITESEFSRSETRWSIVQKLARTRRHIFIYVNQSSAVVVPRHAFENSPQWDAFYEFCKQKTAKAA